MAKRVVKHLDAIVDDKGSAKKVQKGLEGINRTGKHVEGTIDRMTKGAAGFTSNSTKGFAKQAQGLGGLVHVYATIAANVFALSSAFLLLQRNADLQIMEKAAEQLSRSTGINFAKVARSMKDVTNGALAMQDALQTANLGLSSGLSGAQVTELANVANKAAQATGRDAAQSVQRLVQAVAKGEPELADELGIIIRVEKAVNDYALAHNKAATDLTTFERQQAIAIQAIQRGNKAFKDVKVDVNPWIELGATFREISKDIISLVQGPFSVLASFLSKNTGLMTALMLLFANTVLKKALPAVQDFATQFSVKMAKVASDAAMNSMKIREQLAQVSVGYSEFFTRSGTISKTIEKVVPQMALAGQTAVKRALNRGLSGQQLIDAFAKTFSRRQGDIANLMDQLLDPMKKKVTLAGAEMSRSMGLAILAGIAKSDERMSVANQKMLDNLKDQYEGATKYIKGTISSTFLKVQEFTSNMKADFSSGLEEGFRSTFRTYFSDVTTMFDIVKEQTKSTWRGFTAASGVAIAGAVKGFISLAGAALTWASIIFGVVAIGKQVLTVLGAWDNKLDSITEKTEEMVDNISAVEDKIDDIIFDTIISNADDLLTLFRKQQDAAEGLVDQLKQAEEQLHAITNMGPIQAFFTIGEEEDLAKILQATIKEYDRLAEMVDKDPISLSIDIPERAWGLVEQELGKTGKFSKVLERVNDGISETVTLSGETTVAEYLRVIEELGKANSDILDKEVLKPLKEKLLEVKEIYDTQSAAFQDVIQTTIDIENRYNKLSGGLLNNTPFSKDLAAFVKIQDKLAETPWEEMTEAWRRIEESTNGVIDSEETLAVKIKELTRLQFEYTVNKERQAMVTARMANAQKKADFGSIDALDKRFDLETDLLELKKIELDLTLAQKRAEIELAKDANTRNALAYAYIALAWQRAALDDKEIEAIRVKNRDLAKLEMRHDAINAKMHETTAEYEKQATLVKSQFDRGEGSRRNVLLAEQAVILNDLLNIEEELRQIRAEAAKSDASGKNDAIKKVADLQKKRAEQEEKLKANSFKYTSDTLKIEEKRVDTAVKLLDSSVKNTELYSDSARLQSLLAKKQLISVQYAKKEQVLRKESKDSQQLALDLLNLELEKRAELIELERQRIDLQLKNTNEVFSPEGMKAIGDKFAMIAYDFAQKMKSSGELFVDVVSTGMNSAADAFGAALKNDFEGGLGEALKNIGRAALDGMKDVFIEQAVTGIKALGNQIFANMFGGSFSPADTELSVLQEIRDILAGKTSQSAFTQLDKDGILSKGNCKCTDAVEDFFGYTPESMREGAEDITDTLHEAKFSFKNVFTGMIDIFKNGAVGVANGLNALISSLTSQSGGGGIGSIFGSLIGPIFNGIVGGMFGSFATVGSGIAAQTGFTGGVSGVLSGAEFASFAKGGIMSSMGEVALKRYATGGIANSPQMALYGEGSMPEAYVPLPDGRSIPVTMDGGGTTNNVTVIVNYDGGSGGETRQQNSSVASEQGVREFSQMISNKVKEELLNQTRPGGMLSR